jgi:hypothetical protein
MLQFWPLKAPPKIAGDSETTAVNTSWTAVGIPTRLDGEKPRYVMVTWDGDVWIHTRSRSVDIGPGDRGIALNPRQQPYVFDLMGEPLGLYFFRYTTPATDVHLTPLENQ